MDNGKKKAGRTALPKGEKKVQSYYYTKEKNKKKIADIFAKQLIKLDR